MGICRARKLQEESVVKDNITYWVGMDVHADSIQVAVYRENETSPLEEYTNLTDTKAQARLLKKLRGLSGDVRCVYEAGPCGYELQRFLTSKGIRCEVTAPALIPRKAGDRVKTDRRDARNLGRLYRSGDLTMIHIPEQEQEAIRDLVRAREDAVEDVMRKRHRLGKFLLRHGHRYQGKRWKQAHMNWMKTIHFDIVSLQTVMDEYLLVLAQAEDQLKRLTLAIEEISKTPECEKSVAALMTLRGVQTVTAMTILSEIGDMRRFGKAREFMAAIGLVPSEYSSGKRTCRGSITKTGNVHVRRVLVEAAWHYRHKTVGPGIRARRIGQPPEVIDVAQKADARLCRKYWRIADRGKRLTTVVVAVARELAGFVWAIGQLVHA